MVELAFQDKEEIVGVGVSVPDELTLHLDHHDDVVVQLRQLCVAPNAR